jgi:hypothetical protein
MTKAFTLLPTLAILMTGCAMWPRHEHATTQPKHEAEHKTPFKKVSFHILPGTTSPSGKYAIAWGIHGNDHVDWPRLENGDDQYLDSLLGNDPNQSVEDDLVNRQSHKVIGTLHGVHYWKIANRSENNAALQAGWRADEELLLVIHQGKWTFQSFDAVTLKNGAQDHQSDIGKQVSTELRTWLKKSHPNQYTDDLVISIGTPGFKNGQNTFGVPVSAEVPKADSGFSFDGKATFKIVQNNSHTVRVELLSVKKSP